MATGTEWPPNLPPPPAATFRNIMLQAGQCTCVVPALGAEAGKLPQVQVLGLTRAHSEPQPQQREAKGEDGREGRRESGGKGERGERGKRGERERGEGEREKQTPVLSPSDPSSQRAESDLFCYYFILRFITGLYILGAQ